MAAYAAADLAENQGQKETVDAVWSDKMVAYKYTRKEEYFELTWGGERVVIKSKTESGFQIELKTSELSWYWLARSVVSYRVGKEGRKDDIGGNSGRDVGGVHDAVGQGTGAYVSRGSFAISKAGSFPHPPQSPLRFSIPPSSSPSPSPSCPQTKPCRRLIYLPAPLCVCFA